MQSALWSTWAEGAAPPGGAGKKSRSGRGPGTSPREVGREGLPLCHSWLRAQSSMTHLSSHTSRCGSSLPKAIACHCGCFVPQLKPEEVERSHSSLLEELQGSGFVRVWPDTASKAATDLGPEDTGADHPVVRAPPLAKKGPARATSVGPRSIIAARLHLALRCLPEGQLRAVGSSVLLGPSLCCPKSSTKSRWLHEDEGRSWASSVQASGPTWSIPGVVASHGPGQT